jgi:hypothetical protein
MDDARWIVPGWRDDNAQVNILKPGYIFQLGLICSYQTGFGEHEYAHKGPPEGRHPPNEGKALSPRGFRVVIRQARAVAVQIDAKSYFAILALL